MAQKPNEGEDIFSKLRVDQNTVFHKIDLVFRSKGNTDKDINQNNIEKHNPKSL